MFSVPQSSLSQKACTTFMERSRRSMASFTFSFSMPVAATTSLIVSPEPLPSILSRISSSDGCVESTRK